MVRFGPGARADRFREVLSCHVTSCHVIIRRDKAILGGLWWGPPMVGTLLCSPLSALSVVLIDVTAIWRVVPVPSLHTAPALISKLPHSLGKAALSDSRRLWFTCIQIHIILHPLEEGSGTLLCSPQCSPTRWTLSICNGCWKLHAWGFLFRITVCDPV